MGASPGERLRLFRNRLRLTQKVFAEELGFSEPVVRYIETDRRKPSRQFLVKLAERYGVSSDWLLDGSGAMMRGVGPAFVDVLTSSADQSSVRGGEVTIEGAEFALIRRFDLAAAAGAGSAATDEVEKEPLAFRRDWLARRGLSPKTLVLIRAAGDSMLPVISDGDLVMIDRAVTEIPVAPAHGRPAEIMVVRQGGDLRIKRVARPAADLYLLLSDSATHAPDAVQGEDLLHFQVIGRVVWWGHATV